MALVDPSTARRRQAERVMVEEGQALWRNQCEERRHLQLREQKELQDMLARYSPWGRPGGGAPNTDTLRKRKLHLYELYPDGDKARSAGCAFSGHHPRAQGRGGSGGGGGGARGGSGGAGAGSSVPSSAAIRSDAMISFQANEAGHRCVDNVLRYRQPPQQQQAYRKELDAMVQERRRQKQEEVNRCSERERWRKRMRKGEYKSSAYVQAALRAPWGRPGPGGFLWRDPGAIGFGFLQSLGWSDESALRALASRHFTGHENNGETGGVELVPLLARRRTPNVERHPLSSTDVTRAGGDVPASRVDFKTAHARSYTADLSEQVKNKQQYQHRERQEEVESSRRHFATWQSLWGRPGHGAPKEDALRRLNLDHLLRRLPVA